jgi:hypothetical protein
MAPCLHGPHAEAELVCDLLLGEQHGLVPGEQRLPGLWRVQVATTR